MDDRSSLYEGENLEAEELGNASAAGGPGPFCMVKDCGANLSDSKAYYKRCVRTVVLGFSGSWVAPRLGPLLPSTRPQPSSVAT
jgi:hypothetical protein